MRKYILALILFTSCYSIQTNDAKKDIKKIYSNNKTVKVYLSYKNPKIELKNGIYYVNGNPYRGIVVKNGNEIINEVDIEQYLLSVVPSEMPASFDIEALKAQAVAARTYAINTKKLDDTVATQVYKGVKSENSKVSDAVNKTKGEIIVYNNKPIEALYHSSAGEFTLSAKEVYGRDIPYLVSVKDYTEDKKWVYSISKSEYDALISADINNLTFNDKKNIRNKIGASKIKTSDFIATEFDGTVYFEGKGYGHKVGLSQYGANNMAKMGYNYEQIIKHYYTGVNLKRIY